MIDSSIVSNCRKPKWYFFDLKPKQRLKLKLWHVISCSVWYIV